MARSFISRCTIKIAGSYQAIRSAAAAFVAGEFSSLNAQLLVLRSKLDTLQRFSKDTQQSVLFAEVGRALTAWSKMEEVLVIIVAKLLKVHPEKAGIVMYSIYNSNTWLSVIHDLFETEEHPKLQRRFDKIGERIRGIKDIRDQLAHHSIRMSEKESPFIRPSRSDARSKSKKLRPLESSEVGKFIGKVLDIADDLHNLIAEFDSSPQKSDTPTHDQRPPTDSQLRHFHKEP